MQRSPLPLDALQKLHEGVNGVLGGRGLIGRTCMRHAQTSPGKITCFIEGGGYGKHVSEIYGFELLIFSRRLYRAYGWTADLVAVAQCLH